ncbi:MAG: single-stranded-DNA-specific exonuclease RecJ [Microgenomates group bacterium]
MIVKVKNKIRNNEKISNDQIIKILLKNRGIKDEKNFFYPPLPTSISLFDFDKKYEKSFQKVIEILKEIKTKNQKIVVYTDYDADGITGGAIMWETLYLLGFDVMPYVPDRVKEGYGFSIKGINNVIEKYHPSLIISVDHGITKVKEVDYLRSKNIKVIITDHHLKSNQTPNAQAIFHIPALSGSGVAYFFAKEVFNNFKNHSLNSRLLENYFSSDYLSLASIGTIADLVPLIGPSRSIVKYGLEIFPKVRRVGIRHILKEAGIEGKKITPYEIGFMIAPRINASGRLENAIDSLRLLCTKKEDRALKLAAYVGKINRQRQDLLEKSVNEARFALVKKMKQLNFFSATCVDEYSFKKEFFALAENKNLSANDLKNIPKLIILISKNWHEGIIGLIASKIADEFYRPTIVLTKSNGHYKASARSIKGFHITNFLRELRGFLIEVGGHEQAAGFSIEEKQVNQFIKIALEKANEQIEDQILEKTFFADLQIPVSLINLNLVKHIENLAPFGISNPQPVFYSEVILSDAKIFGKKNEHLKIFVKDENSLSSTNTLELIAFNQAHLFSSLSRHQKIKVLYTLEIDHWGNQEKLRGKVIKIF